MVVVIFEATQTSVETQIWSPAERRKQGRDRAARTRQVGAVGKAN
jgi:hypothetical protein